MRRAWISAGKTQRAARTVTNEIYILLSTICSDLSITISYTCTCIKYGGPQALRATSYNSRPAVRCALLLACREVGWRGAASGRVQGRRHREHDVRELEHACVPRGEHGEGVKHGPAAGSSGRERQAGRGCMLAGGMARREAHRAESSAPGRRRSSG